MNRVIFMGTPEYAQKILKALYESKKYEIVALYTQPDKPVGRKKLLTPPITKSYALGVGLDVFQPVTLKDADVIAHINTLKPDIIVVAAYGQILPKEILSLAPCINLHASILPQYRGASPIQHALLNNDTVSGVTAMLMNEGLDTGDVLGFSYVQITSYDTSEILFDKLTSSAVELTLSVLESFIHLRPLAQNNYNTSVCKKIKKEHGLIENWSDAQEIFNKYRAFTPWPGIYLQDGLKLLSIRLLETQSRNKAGEILSMNKQTCTIGCEKGSLEIIEVQPASKKPMFAYAYLNGQRVQIGDTFF